MEIDETGTHRLATAGSDEEVTDAKFQTELKDEEAFKAIKEGVKADDKTKMKAFSDLTDDEVKALVAHVRSFKK